MKKKLEELLVDLRKKQSMLLSCINHTARTALVCDENSKKILLNDFMQVTRLNDQINTLEKLNG